VNLGQGSMGSSWGQAGVKLGSSWGQAGVKLGSSWGQAGATIGRMPHIANTQDTDATTTSDDTLAGLPQGAGTGSGAVGAGARAQPQDECCTSRTHKIPTRRRQMTRWRAARGGQQEVERRWAREHGTVPASKLLTSAPTELRNTQRQLFHLRMFCGFGRYDNGNYDWYVGRHDVQSLNELSCDDHSAMPAVVDGAGVVLTT